MGGRLALQSTSPYQNVCSLPGRHMRFQHVRTEVLRPSSAWSRLSSNASHHGEPMTRGLSRLCISPSGKTTHEVHLVPGRFSRNGLTAAQLSVVAAQKA
jgi:hypothetical protein